MSVAAVQQHLQASGKGEPIAVAPYLSKLCATLAQSMTSDSSPISLEVVAGEASLSSNDAVSVGLIVTEGVLNALKHAFAERTAGGRIVVTYDANGPDWTLTIADDGVGKRINSPAVAKGGLGTSIINALAQQLAARVDLITGESGTTLAIIHSVSVLATPTPAHLHTNEATRVI